MARFTLSFFQTIPIALAVSAVVCSTTFAAEPVAGLIAKGDAFDRKLATREALEVYLEAEKLEPGNSGVLHRISKQYAELMPDTQAQPEKRKLGETALAYARRAVESDPASAKAQLSLAICYGRMAELLDNKTKIAYSKLVKEHAEKALKLDPSDSYAHHILGAWNYELANLNPVLRAIAGFVYGRLPSASNEVAVGYFRKAIELAPQRVSHRIELGRTYAAMGKSDLARAEIEKGLSLPNREKDDGETKQRGRNALKKL